MASHSFRENLTVNRKDLSYLCDYLSTWGEVWVPNTQTYENTSERIWYNIERHTPKDARIVVACSFQREIDLSQKNKPPFLDLGERKIEFVLADCSSCRGLYIGKGDFLLISRDITNLKWVVNVLLPLMQCELTQHVFCRHILSPLLGEIWFEITSIEHPIWREFLTPKTPAPLD